MVLRTFFCLDVKKLNNLRSIDLPENIFLCFKIVKNERGLVESFFAALYELRITSQFCISIEDEDLISSGLEHLERLLILIMFHHKYLSFILFRPVVVSKRITDRVGDNFYNSIDEYCRRSGYNGIDLIARDLEVSLGASDEKKQTLVEIKDTYKRILTTDVGGDASLFINVESYSDIRNVSELIKEVEIEVKEYNPFLFSLVKERADLLRAKDENMKRISILEKRLSSLASYSSIYSSPVSRKMLKDIVDFYNKEYEILPIWYKRLGHIIKVIMGKRTVKSLFNKNVKKYLD